MNWRFSVVIIAILAGCTAPSETTMTLATTTSTRDSGLLDVLVPLYEQKTGIKVKVVAVGSGQALELGRRGDADVLLTHAPAAERQFMSEGYGESHQAVMYNDFVLVGPTGADMPRHDSIADAFRDIARQEMRFTSRGDESGTHLKEKAIWSNAGLEPEGPWYIEAGTGMAEVLRMAAQLQALTLSDRATYLAHRESLKLTIYCEGDPLLRNPYAVIVVSSVKHPHLRTDAARRFAEFLLSDGARQVIRDFGREPYGQPLFFIDEPTEP